jgi:V8-like Glu-specific endopeptidase
MSRLDTAPLACAVAGPLTAGIIAVPAIIFGHMARRRVRRTGERGFTGATNAAERLSAISRILQEVLMIALRSMSKPSSPLETLEPVPGVSPVTRGHPGTVTAEVSRSLRHLAVRGKSDPTLPPFETVIGRDERVRILDTNLAPRRMICALRMRGPSGAGAIGTGWFIGPKTVLTAGHRVFSTAPVRPAVSSR